MNQSSLRMFALAYQIKLCSFSIKWLIGDFFPLAQTPLITFWVP
uniref:Uncharacterized protein n=1 Tax=Rhizophora mucronata TaxID=61149 RepID=A0A2P2NJG7_RHIMU